MSQCRDGSYKHHNPSPSHAIGAWCNDCGSFEQLGSFFEPLESPKDTYFIDGRDDRIPEELRVTWDTERKTWVQGADS